MAGVLRRHAAWVDVAAPVVLVVAVGATWIAVHASAGRGQVHTVFQVLVLAENAVALLLRRRKPVGALAGILVVYLLVDLDAITILPVLIALLTVAEMRTRRVTAIAGPATAAIVVAMPYLHGDQVNVVTGPLLHLAAVAIAVALGSWPRARVNRARGESGPVEAGEHV
jgi:hypothetical protein